MLAQDALAAMWNFARNADLASKAEDVAVAPKQDTAYKNNNANKQTITTCCTENN